MWHSGPPLCPGNRPAEGGWTTPPFVHPSLRDELTSPHRVPAMNRWAILTRPDGANRCRTHPSVARIIRASRPQRRSALGAELRMFCIGGPALRTDDRPACLGSATGATANHRQPHDGEGDNDKHDDDGHRAHVSTTLLSRGCLLSVGSVPQSGGRRTYKDVSLLERSGGPGGGWPRFFEPGGDDCLGM